MYTKKGDSDMPKLTYKKILFLIAYTIALLLIPFNIEKIISAIGSLLSILSPFFIALCIAFVVNLPMKRIEPGISKKLKKKTRRGIAIFLSFALIVLFFGTILFFLVPQVVESSKIFSAQIGGYIKDLEAMLTHVAEVLHIPQEVWSFLIEQINSIFDAIASFAIAATPHLLNATLGVANGTINFFIGLVLSFYLLSSKEELISGLRRLLKAIFSEKVYDYLNHVGDVTHKTFTSFISGQLLESCILGSLCTIGLVILQIDYALLIGVIIGFSSLIPIFGSILGTIPCVLILLVINPRKAFVFLVFIFVLQQLEGDIIYPRVVGKSIGISGLWVMLAMIVGGSLIGVFGLIIGIPIFATAYILIQEWVDIRIKIKDEKIVEKIAEKNE